MGGSVSDDLIWLLIVFGTYVVVLNLLMWGAGAYG